MSHQPIREVSRRAGRRRIVRLEDGVMPLADNAVNGQQVRPRIETVLQRTRRLVESLEEGILWSGDTAGLHAEFVGHHVIRRLGYPAGWWFGDRRSWTDRVHTADFDRVMTMVREAIEHGTETRCEHRLVAADGTTHWFDSSAHPAPRGRGIAATVRGLSTEIPNLETARRADRARARHAEAIVQLARRTRGTTEPGALIEAGLRAATTTLGADFGEVFELAHDGQSFRLRGAIGWNVDLVDYERIAADGRSELSEALRSGRAFVRDRLTDTAYARRARLESHAVVSGVSVAIRGDYGPCGVLSVHSRVRRTYSPEEWQFLRVVADMIGAAVERSRPDIAGRECHDLLEGLRDAPQDAIIVKDADGHYALVNETAARLFGRPARELLGRNDDDLLGPDAAQALAARDRAYMLAGRDTIAPSTGEIAGTERTYLVARGAVRDRESQIAGLVGVYREVATPAVPEEPDDSDVTGPRRAIWPDALAVLMSAPAAVAFWRGAGLRCTLTNRRHSDLLGAHDSNNASPRDAFAVLGRHELLDAFERVLATGESIQGIEARMPAEPGRRAMVLSFSLEPLRDHNAVIRGVISAAFEVPNAEPAQLRVAAGASAPGNDVARERSDLLAVVSHELGSPLAAIMLTTETLLQSALKESDGRLRKAAESIQRCAARMARLVGDMRDVATLSAGRLSVRSRPCDVSVLLDDASATLRSLAETASLRFEIVAPDQSVRVQCDRERIGQVFCNLVGNAIKFTPAGGSVDLRVEVVDEQVVFSVTDTGRGLTPLQAARVFDQYWQADDATRRGSGLGLFISRGIVEKHGGRIWVESTPGRGSSFRFTLPVARESSHPQG